MELVNSFELSTWIPVLAADSSFLETIVSRFWNYFQVALGLGFVIFIHELGHFMAAKFFGVKCEKFYVGFDVPISIGPIKLPRTLGKFQWGETEYGIGIIPLGGYVKMLGQDDDPRNAQAEAERIRNGDAASADRPTNSPPVLDPRSYPAKPVYARMIIISAGVIMNLISAVFMAGAAYMYGVSYSPTVVGSVVGGSPAWESGLSLGDHVVQVAHMKTPDERLSFRDLATKIATSGLNDEKALIPLTVQNDTGTKVFAIQGTKRFTEGARFVSLGFDSSTVAKVSDAEAFPPFSFLSKANVDIKPGDRFISINAEQLPLSKDFGEVLGFELTKRFQKNFYKPVDVVVERKQGEATEQHTVTLPPTPMKGIGIGFKPSPVRVVAKDSLAKYAGVQVGDSITKVDGEPVLDGWTLPLIVARKGAEAPVSLTLVRGSAEVTPQEYQITLEPFEPSFDSIAPVGGMLTIKHLGIAYELEPEVSFVEAESPAAKAGIQVGDKLTKIKFLPTDEMKDKLKISSPSGDGMLKIDHEFTPACFMVSLQMLPAELDIRLISKRGEVVQEHTVKNVESAQHFWYTRGISMSPLTKVLVAESVSDALVLGLGNTWGRLGEVVDFLRMLVTGRVPIGLLGGPVRIVQAASMQASEGVPTFLLFLTLLSANLAVINFLPIPALDGGHIMFLTAEAAMGKPVNEAWQIRLTVAGVLGLLSLMAFVIINDIVHIAF